MSQAIDDLIKEHEAILMAMGIFDEMLDRLDHSEMTDPVDFSNFIGFLKEFTDKCHHGKEEGYLFPALIVNGIADEGGPIGVMMAEHNQGRKLIYEMEQVLNPTLNTEKLKKFGKEYVSLIKSHIQKENRVLFPLAEKVLLEQDLKKMYENFEEHEEKVIGHGRHDALHVMLEMLHDKYSE